jgi:hypothetical protein
MSFAGDVHSAVETPRHPGARERPSGPRVAASAELPIGIVTNSLGAFFVVGMLVRRRDPSRQDAQSYIDIRMSLCDFPMPHRK